MLPHSPLRLKVDSAALVSNWRWLCGMSNGAACGAAVKANGYGLGAAEVVTHLARAGCRDFFVATWAEAEALAPVIGSASLSVLHGFAEEDLPLAMSSLARPVLSTPRQVMHWREAGQGRPCDVMVDTGINRIGLSPRDAASGMLDDLNIETLMSHLACADEDQAMNARQLADFQSIAAIVPAKRLSLANSAGICLGPEYGFGLTRPGLALYGGISRPEAEGHVAQVARIEAQLIQRRRVEPGDTVGYNRTFAAERGMELAIVNIGYADGYVRSFSDRGRARIADRFAPVVGRVSMDMTAICIDDLPEVGEGDWIEMDFDLPSASSQSGLSQYELLTMLGSRYRRIWS